MGVRGLRIKQERLLQYEVSSSVSSPPLPTLDSIAFPPIFLSPASISVFDTPSPSPSPLPVAAGSAHHQVPTAAIIGGSVASVVALAATTTIIATVAGKAGLACLFGPLCKLLSCLGERILAPACTAERLKSLRETIKKWRPPRKRRRSSEAADDNEGSAAGDGDLIYEILGGSPGRASDDIKCTAAAAQFLTTSPLPNIEQLQTSAQAYLVTTVSDSVESELKKKEQEMIQPLYQRITNAQGYAESLLSTAVDDVVDDLRPLSDEVHRLKAKANYVKASAEARAAMRAQPGSTVLAMFDQAIKTEVEEVSKRCRLASKKLQGPVLVEEEVVLHRKREKPAATTSTHTERADELEDEELKHRMLLNEAGRKSGQACIVESASDATTQLEILEEKPGAPAAHKQNLSVAAPGAAHSLALVPTSDTGDIVTDNKRRKRAIISVPEKVVVPMQGKTMVSSKKKKLAKNDVSLKANKNKRKQPTNLGQVSFSCQMSTQRLRFFTSCKSGGTYGSSTNSPEHTLTSNSITCHNQDYNFHHDKNILKFSSLTSGDPNSAHYQTYVPFHNAFHHTLMPQQVYHPSQSILVQHSNNNVALPSLEHMVPLSLNPVEVASSTVLSHNPHKPSNIDDYGGPFDGVL